MRRGIAAIVAALAFVGLAAKAEAPSRAPVADPQPGCEGRRDALGVSRVVEVDPQGGPRFGLQQYGEIDFLKDGEVVLTFDDGPSRSHTLPILEALDAECTRATFFVVGRMAVADPALVRETERRGHTIGTHTWSHRNLRSLSAAQARHEIELGISAVSRVLGHPVAPFFRFPFLSDPGGMIAHLKSRDIGLFSIDVDSLDFRTRRPADVHRRVLAQLAEKRKGIILFHDIQPSTAHALRGLLAELRARGFKVVHMLPKAPVRTLSEYDAQAEKALSAKQLAAESNPLATRALVWPVASGFAAPAQGKLPASAGAAPGAAAQVPGPAEPLSRPAQRGEDDDEPWQSRVFRN
jgi:peptidoglycan/xylan/chitin deacetylase (PgdA/CDA1 family)